MALDLPVRMVDRRRHSECDDEPDEGKRKQGMQIVRSICADRYCSCDRPRTRRQRYREREESHLLDCCEVDA